MKKDGFEYWNSEGMPTRVQDVTGKVEVYRDGVWKTDKWQTHPRARGLDESSDNTPIGDEAELKALCSRNDGR